MVGEWRRRAKRAAPAPPYAPPSVERKISVRSVVGRARLPAAHTLARARRARPSPPRCPHKPLRPLSRWATTRIASSDRPGTTVTMFRSSTSPRSTRSSLQTSSSRARVPNGLAVPARGASASSVPGTREGYSVESSVRPRLRRGVEQRVEGRPRKRSRCRYREQEREGRRHDDERADPDEARVEGLATVPRRLRPRGRAASIAGL